MPVGGIGSHPNSYGVHSTSNNMPNNDGADKLTSPVGNNLKGVTQSEYGFSRGHQRNHAVDLRADISTTLVDKLGSGTQIKR